MLEFDGVLLRQGAFELRADWSVPKGAKVALIGPSGAGKSTLLSAIAGFLEPVEGELRWEGSDLAALSPERRPVTTLFQDQNLFPHLTAAQNVGLGLSPGLRLAEEDWKRVDEALARVGLEGLGPRLPRELSGGQAGRVALARALLRSQPLLLLDEPFAALGPGLKQDMHRVLEDVLAATEATLFMVTHDPTDACHVANLAIYVDDGVAHAPVATEALFADPPEGLRRYLGL